MTEKRAVAKSGSGLADIVTPANYDASCTYAANCNQPNWTKDAKGNPDRLHLQHQHQATC